MSKPLSFALGLASLSACMPPATVETTPVLAAKCEAAPGTSERRYARLSSDVTLYADPSTLALRVEWVGGERVVELIEARDGFWQIRTLLPREVVALGFDASASLDVLTLIAWVDQREVVEIEPESASSSGSGSAPGSSEAAALPRGGSRKFDVPAGSVLRWPDGRVAGEVAADHFFFTPATAREAEGPDGALSLGCHQSRTPPIGGSITGWLCTAEEPGAGVAVNPVSVVALDRPPKLVGESHEVEGALDRDIIRRIVRAHINEVRSCYNAGLAVDPQLSGRVAINFVIGGDGYVKSAVVQEDSLSDPEVGRCIAKAAATWQFPKPRGGGNVIVTYPFNLSPG